MLIKGTEELIKGTEELNFKHLRYRITRKPSLTISWAFLYQTIFVNEKKSEVKVLVQDSV